MKAYNILGPFYFGLILTVPLRLVNGISFCMLPCLIFFWIPTSILIKLEIRILPKVVLFLVQIYNTGKIKSYNCMYMYF